MTSFVWSRIRTPVTRVVMTLCVAGFSVVVFSGCDGDSKYSDDEMRQPDVLPKIVNNPLPFRYPPALYADKIQGNVLLRLFVDSLGTVHPESTVIVEPSTVPMLDSAALRGSRELQFEPATKRGNPIPVSIVFPVHFRHPEAEPMQGDSLAQSDSSSDTTT